MIFDIHHQEIAEAVARAFYEDVGIGDLTSEACIPEGWRADGRFIARQKLVVAGVELLNLMFDKVTMHKRSGDTAEDGEVIATESSDEEDPQASFDCVAPKRPAQLRPGCLRCCDGENVGGRASSLTATPSAAKMERRGISFACP